MTYLFIKWLHIISATILFGTGLGTAFHFYLAYRHGDPVAIHVSARTTVLADWLFTASSGVVQPLTGAMMIYLAGWDPQASWLLLTYALYLLALGCWLQVVRLQIRMRDLAAAAVASGSALGEDFHRQMRWWFALGWPAFLALTGVFWLMVVKPNG